MTEPDQRLLDNVLTLLRNDIASMRSEMLMGFRDAKDRMGAMERNIAHLSQGIANLHGDFANVSVRLDHVDKRLDRIESRLQLIDPEVPA